MLKLILILCVFEAFSVTPKYGLSRKIFDNSKLPFISHQGPGPLENYLSMEVQFEPVADLFKQLLVHERSTLTNRGEAHITVLTPVEYHEILKSKLSIKEIDELAKKHKLQQSTFTIVCMGEANLEINNKVESTFYIVIRSPDLLKLREEIQKAWLAKGGEKEMFRPEYFYPHITVGYTLRDLHMNDGIIKDESTCVRDINLTK